MSSARDGKSSPRVQAIYCDESGFTGQNLLDRQQRIFAYAAVAIDAGDAQALLTQAQAVLGISNAIEIKSSTLLGSVRGRAALVEIVRAVGDRAVVFMAEKKFALACKFFEYVFEPILAENNGFFYLRGFHKFIANLLYITLVVHDPTAEQMIVAFQRFMRSRDSREIGEMLGPTATNEDGPIKQMLDIARVYRNRIGDELDTLGGNDAIGRWVLDLSSSALFVLLGHWGEKYDVLDVYCDRSKPLETYPDLFNAMVGRSERSYMTFEDRVTPVTFNLARPINFVNSRDHAGVRVADLIAGAITYATREDDANAVAFGAAICDFVAVNPLRPQLELVDLNQRRPYLNAMLLHQLHKRAESGADPLEGIVDEHQLIELYYDVSPPHLGHPGK